MVWSNRFEMATPDVVAEDFNSEIVILNLAKGKYYSLTSTAVEIWNALLSGTSPKELLSQFQNCGHKHAKEVESFILTLIDEELICPTSSETAHTLQTEKYDLNLSNDLEPPVLTAFDDMAELILADPIHDTDEEVGWPVTRVTD